VKSLLNTFVLVGLTLLPILSWSNSDPQQAYQLVEEKIDSLLSEIRTTKSQASLTDDQRIALVDQQLGGVVDFKRIARRVMAKHYRNANKEQKQRFLAVFKTSLLNTYAKGLWEFNNYKVNMLPLKVGKQTLRNTQVSFEVITSSGQVFPVTQSLFYDKKSNQWMVQNVIINGINMGLLFRDQFARLAAQNNGDIDLAIRGWTSEVSSDNTAQPQGTDIDEPEDE
jgi:phospholipid transport system substrate-binding protein